MGWFDNTSNRDLLNELRSINAELRITCFELLAELRPIRRLLWRSRPPGRFSAVRVISEETMEDGTMLVIQADFELETDAPDLEKLVFQLLVGGAVVDAQTQELALDDRVVTFRVAQDTADCVCSITAYDDGGNAGAPIVSESFMALDTIGPEVTGGFTSIKVVDEEADPLPE